MDIPTIKNKWIEVYFGLFGPCLTYHTNRYDDDNAHMVISLIFCQIYLTLPWKHNIKSNADIGFNLTYGFYSSSEPDLMIFVWGMRSKVWFMPWSKVIIKRELLNVHGEPVVCTPDDAVTYESMLKEVMALPSNYFHEAHGYGMDFRYFVARIETCPRLFRRLKLFSKTSYEIYVYFEKDFNGYTNMLFNTETNIALPEQIELQLMMQDQFYMDF